MIYSSTVEDHLVQLEKVLNKLRQNHVKEKFEFAQTEIKFLGHLISKSQIRMDGAKVTTIRDLPAPPKAT